MYNAANTEWPDYLCHFEQGAMWNDWTDAEKATQLVMSLRGRAQKVLSELSFRELHKYCLSSAGRFVWYTRTGLPVLI